MYFFFSLDAISYIEAVEAMMIPVFLCPVLIQNLLAQIQCVILAVNVYFSIFLFFNYSAISFYQDQC